MTDAGRKNSINRLVDLLDACTRACHDRDDAALERALGELLMAATFFRLRVREALHAAKKAAP